MRPNQRIESRKAGGMPAERAASRKRPTNAAAVGFAGLLEAGAEKGTHSLALQPLAPLVDLDNCIPAYLTSIANKLSRGASQAFLATFGIGVETWRLLVLLAVHGSISPQFVARVIGMDKASISRTFKAMKTRGYVRIGLDDADGRMRIATITARGRKLHDRALGVARERERALLAVLSEAEHTALIGVLRRLHENLPAVEEATACHLATHFPRPRRRRGRAAHQDRDE